MKGKKILSTVLAVALVVTGVNVTAQKTEAAKKPAIAKKNVSVNVKGTVKLKLKNATKSTRVKWSVKSKKIAKITRQTKKGKKAYAKVYGVSAGKTTVTAKITYGKKKTTSTCTVVVNDGSKSDKVTTASTAPEAVQTQAPVSVTQSAVPTAVPTSTVAPTAAPTKAASSTNSPTRTSTPRTATPVPTPRFARPDTTAEPVVAVKLVKGCLHNEYVDEGNIVYNSDMTVTVTFNKQYQAVNFYLPDNAQNYYSEYKYATIVYNSTGEALGHSLYDANCIPDGSRAGGSDVEPGKQSNWDNQVVVSAEDKTLQFEVTSECAGGCIRGLQIFNLNETGKVTTINIKYVIFSNGKDVSSVTNPGGSETPATGAPATAVPASEAPATEPPATEPHVTDGYKATFDIQKDDNNSPLASITTYRTQRYDVEEEKAENQTEAIATGKDTGETDISGDGQINFTVVPKEGYVVKKVTVTPKDNYKNLKGRLTTKLENTYRITKVKGDIQVNVTVQREEDAEPEHAPYNITFNCPEGAHIEVYEKSNFSKKSKLEGPQTETVSRDGDSGVETAGDPTIDDSYPQVNFVVVIDNASYIIKNVEITDPEGADAKGVYYDKRKTHDDETEIPENGYRITKIGSDLEVTIELDELAED